jgi:hypothetical protein
MAAFRLSLAHLLHLVAVAALASGCAPLRSGRDSHTTKPCTPAATRSGYTDEIIRTPRYTRTQIARSFSGGSPSAATRIVWVTHEDSCL